MSQPDQTKEWLLNWVLEPKQCPIHQVDLVICGDDSRLTKECPECGLDNLKEKTVSLNERQKIAALAMRFYQGMKWEPKVGDYYCLSREGLEMFQITRSDGENFYITKVYDPGQNVTLFGELQDPWKITDFQEGFGKNRVWVHPIVLEKVK